MQKFMRPLNMNGLEGRMLRMSGSKDIKKEILLVYGHHSSLERMFGLAEAFNDYGAVTMPDLPGFGGMDSYHDIGIVPSIDSMADYMASFIRLRYRKKKITIVAMSLGFVIITRMLQRYPELASRVELLISVVGFSHKYDFELPRSRMFFYKNAARILSRKIPAAFFYNVALHPSVIRTIYSNTYNAKNKFENLDPAEKKKAMDFEVLLWRINDVRTYMNMTVEFLTLDNCRQQVPLAVEHVSVSADQYFDKEAVEQHMRVIFTDYTEHVAKVPNNAPSILATKREAEPLIPVSIRKLMKSSK